MRATVWLGVGIVLGAGVAPLEAKAQEDAATVVGRMIEAHGGMERWSAAPTVSFTDTFTTPGAAQGSVSRVVVEQGARRAYMDIPGTSMSLTWDGKTCWSQNWELPLPPRFLALLNYYFLNLPWLTQDPGVVLAAPATARLRDDPTNYITVRMTFESGVGDTPEDYYLLYIHPQTHRLRACEYTVTYADLLPEGVKHTPPHTLVYDEFATVEGLLVPTRYSIYEQDGKPYGGCTIEGWSFTVPFDASRMVMPAGAKVDESRPTREAH